MFGKVGVVIAFVVVLVLLVLAAPAGAQVTTFGNEEGALRLPEAIAIAPDGTVLVGDHLSGRIQPFRDGKPVAGAFGLRGETCGRFGAVSGLAAGPDGRVFVLDSDNQRVQVFDADRRLVACFGGRGNARGRFRTGSGSYAASTGSGGIAVDGRYVYVADAGNDRIQRFTLDGRNPKVIGKGVLDDPQGLAVRGGRLLVADDRNHRIAEFTTSGRFVRAASAGLRFPYDVALAPDGRAFVADNNGHRVVVLDRRLRTVRAWGRYGRSPGRLIYPRAVALTKSGNVLVADPGNDRVTEYTGSGRYVRTLGTNGRSPGMVSLPADVAVNARGEVAVADTGNQRISWFDLGGRYLGRWAQGRSFQQSTATVNGPRSVTFAGDARVRVVDGGDIREYGAGRAEVLLGGTPGTARVDSSRFSRAVDTDAAGALVSLRYDGRIDSAGQGGASRAPFGQSDPPDRASTDVAVLGDGSIATAQGGADNRPDPADGVVLRYDARGRLLSSWTLARPPGGEATKPDGLAADGAGGLWVSDAANDRVLHLTPGGDVLATLGKAGSGVGELAGPTGLALDCAGGLLVADTGNNRIVRFAGVQAAEGCASAASRATAASGPPRPVGLRLRVRDRAERPARRLAVVSTRCVRTCRIRAQASLATFGRGRPAQPITLDARVEGRRVVVSAGDRALRALRSALRAKRTSATVAVVVQAEGAGGVVDTAATTMTFRR